MDDRGALTGEPTVEVARRTSEEAPDYAALLHSPARRELEAARRSVTADFRRLHGRDPELAEVDRIIARYWYRVSDAALALLHRAVRRRGRDC